MNVATMMASVKESPLFTPVLKDLQAKVQERVSREWPSLVERADRVLLGLSHSGTQMIEQALNRIESNPDDLVGRIGRSVLERAEIVRQQLIEKDSTWIPEWLNSVKFAPRVETVETVAVAGKKKSARKPKKAKTARKAKAAKTPRKKKSTQE